MDVKGGFYALHPQFAIFPERFQAGGAQRTCECLEISVECHVGGKTFPVNGDLVDLANRLLKGRDHELRFTSSSKKEGGVVYYCGCFRDFAECLFQSALRLRAEFDLSLDDGQSRFPWFFPN